MAHLAGLYLFVGLTYSAWTSKTAPERKFSFSHYLLFVALITFGWPIFAARDLIKKAWQFVFAEDRN